MKKKEIGILAFVAILFVIAGIYFGTKKWEPASPDSDASSYFFSQSLPDVTNSKQELSQWQGKLLLVNFWATWCAPCVEEMPELTELQSEQSFKNLQVIGIGIDSADNIREFTEKHKISYPIYVSGMEGSEMSRKLGNQQGGLPYTVLIGSDGQIKKTYLGRLKMDTVRKDLASFS